MQGQKEDLGLQSSQDTGLNALTCFLSFENSSSGKRDLFRIKDKCHPLINNIYLWDEHVR